VFCEKVEPIVNELATEYPGRVDCKIVKHDAEGSAARIVRYGLDKHGMVVTDQDDKVLWIESGHKQTKAGVVQALTKLLGS
jgi:hypothetical protein